MIKTLVYVHYDKEEYSYEDLNEALIFTESVSDERMCYVSGAYNTDTNTIYVGSYNPERDIADLTKYFELTDPIVKMYKIRNGKVILGDYIELVKPAVGKYVWFCKKCKLYYGRIESVIDKVVRSLDGMPVVVHTMGNPYKQWIYNTEITVISNGKKYKPSTLFRSEEDAKEWKRFQEI